jgi:hypothetical protein
VDATVYAATFPQGARVPPNTDPGRHDLIVSYETDPPRDMPYCTQSDEAFRLIFISCITELHVDRPVTYQMFLHLDHNGIVDPQAGSGVGAITGYGPFQVDPKLMDCTTSSAQLLRFSDEGDAKLTLSIQIDGAPSQVLPDAAAITSMSHRTP